jgi:hypothetical protein
MDNLVQRQKFAIDNMQIIISDKSPVYAKLVSLGNSLALDPSLLAAGMCHAALNAHGTPAAAAYQQPAAPTQQPAPVPEPPQPKAAPSSGMFDLA